jgi:hypothetical protein
MFPLDPVRVRHLPLLVNRQRTSRPVPTLNTPRPRGMSALADIDPQLAAKRPTAVNLTACAGHERFMFCHSPILDRRTSRPACVSQFTFTSADKR